MNGLRLFGTPRVVLLRYIPLALLRQTTTFGKPINVVDTDLTRDEVNSALTIAYEENLKTPSAHTARLWVKLTLVERAEDELERHIKGQLTTFFLVARDPLRC